MVVGESGLGKSTLVNSLFLTDLYPERIIPDAIGGHDLCSASVFEYLHDQQFPFYRETKADGKAGSVDGGDRGTRGQAASDGGGHTRIRRCH